MVRRFEVKLLSLIFIAGGVVAAQSTPPRKDIPTIAKAAKGAIVTIVMAANDKPLAMGTGFLVSPDGVIVTNYHVIKTGNVAVVKFPDGTALPVDGVLASDKVRDLAVIKIHGKTFRSLTLGNSDRVQIGEHVVAIGNPLGLEQTVSDGIVSGRRTVEKEGGKFLQITAPITHGSSGGPLFNMMGEVIGITTLVYEGAGNLNFAIPVNDAKLLLHEQSATLRDLPNEPDESQGAEVPKTPKAKTHQEDPRDQHWCTIRAEKYFQYSVLDYSHVKYAFKAGYSSHADMEKYKCYVEIVLDYGSGHNSSTKDSSSFFFGQRYYIEDATSEGSGGPLFGYLYSFGEYGGTGIEGNCHILSINCRAQVEFHELALKYFGVTQPEATTTILPFGAASTANSHLQPNTKMSAAGLDPAKMTDQQVVEDMRYCIQYPNDSLQEPNGQLVRCRDMMASLEAQACKTGSDSKTEACKNLMAVVAALKEGHL
jgi:Trypsin-like peptidase domain